MGGGKKEAQQKNKGMCERVDVENTSGNMWNLVMTKKQKKLVKHDVGSLHEEVKCDGGAELNAMQQGGDNKPQKVKITMDSGAVNNVAPKKWFPQYPMKESEGSKRGLKYVAANGGKLANLGEKQVRFKTDEGRSCGMTFQCVDVNKALGSVKKICGKGHRVVFDDDWSYIENKATGERMTMQEEGGSYVIEVEVTPNREPGFTRQGC